MSWEVYWDSFRFYITINLEETTTAKFGCSSKEDYSQLSLKAIKIFLHFKLYTRIQDRGFFIYFEQSNISKKIGCRSSYQNPAILY